MSTIVFSPDPRRLPFLPSPSQSHKSNPPTSLLLFSGTRRVAYAFPEPAHPEGADTTLQRSHSLDLIGPVLGNPRRNKERESHWLAELRKVDSAVIDEREYLDETSNAAFHRR